jgi:cysteine desulfurase family protein (TIGR01976 family)
MSDTCATRPFDPSWSRPQFPALQGSIAGQQAVFFDGPAGSQVPQRVLDAISDYLVRMNANHDGLFATSRASDELLHEAHCALADFVGADDPDCIVFGANMTSLNFAVSRALAKTWKPGDEILLSRLDHDANVSPWVLAAQDAGATVRHIDIRREECTLDMDDFRSKLSSRTRLVAVGAASNAVGTINPIAEICRAAHEVGALVFCDAVHYAPHGRIDVRALDCDLLVCSAYKFFGPHVGVLWARRELLEDLPAYKVRPAPNAIPGRWMTGTQNHEGIAGTLAAVEYLAELGRTFGPADANRPAALDAAFATITTYEQRLADRLIAGLVQRPEITVWGLPDASRREERVPTLGITHTRYTPTGLAQSLAERNIFVWHGNFYALPVTEALGLEPEGMVRIGLLHYNTGEEVDRLLKQLDQISPPQ